MNSFHNPYILLTHSKSAQPTTEKESETCAAGTRRLILPVRETESRNTQLHMSVVISSFFREQSIIPQETTNLVQLLLESFALTGTVLHWASVERALHEDEHPNPGRCFVTRTGKNRDLSGVFGGLSPDARYSSICVPYRHVDAVDHLAAGRPKPPFSLIAGAQRAQADKMSKRTPQSEEKLGTLYHYLEHS